MNIYRRYFKVATGPLIDAINIHRQIIKKAYCQYEAICKEIGADVGKFYVLDGRITGFIFSGESVPDQQMLRETDQGWKPRGNTKKGKGLAKKISAVKTSDLMGCLREVGLTDSLVRIVSGGKAYRATLIDIPSDPPLALVSVPWYDENPETLVKYKEDRAGKNHFSANLDAVLWEPSRDMFEIKEWQFKKEIDDWNESIKAKQAAYDRKGDRRMQLAMETMRAQQPKSGTPCGHVDSLVSEVAAHLTDVNLVSFSGGKDSTTVLQLVLAALAGTNKKLYIVTADTLMEIPYFQTYVDGVRGRLQDYIHRYNLNAELVTVRPPAKDSFWVGVLGRGYPAAHMGFRWCTGKLKIDPITKFTRTVTAGREYTVFVGVRSAESELRARIYKQKSYKPHHYAPVLDWSAHDIWEYLLTEPCPWGDHAELVKVYKYSSDECVYGESQGVCVGNARYGCWACPLQKSSQLDMIGMHTGDDRYRELKRFKEALVGMANKTAYRSRIRRNGSVGAGPFLVEIRKRLHADLKNVESATGWKLITQEEEECIREHWVIDADVHNIPDATQPMLWSVCD